MNNTILSWNGIDHRAIYARQLKENPLYYDPNLKVWVVYSYEYCKAVSLNADAHVPQPAFDESNPLNHVARLLIRNMARLSNEPQHENARAAAMMIFQKVKQVDIHLLLKTLLSTIGTCEFDWVEVIALRLPIRVILNSLNFADADRNYIVANLASLVKIMSPLKASDDIQNINSIVNDIYTISEKYIISSRLATGVKAEDELVICNLIGLFIQCYDACRGLLCNTLLNFAGCPSQVGISNNIDYYKALVTETLRWDPPVHTTRRVAIRDIYVGDQTIRAGEIIMIVLAAANLDPDIFNAPYQFNITRNNNEQHLTFGIGEHSCIAKYLCLNIAAEACVFLADNYQNVTIKQKQFSYEPQLNVRLIRELMITLT